MPEYPYVCPNCPKIVYILKPMVLCTRTEYCLKCKSRMGRLYTIPALTGMSDRFKNQNKNFVDDKSGKQITNWKQWEKAGYRNPLETTKDTNVKAGIKRKIDKVKNYSGNKKHFC